MRRRHFITVSAASLGGVLVYGFDRKPTVVKTQPERTIKVPLRFFTTAEALVVAAASARIFPSDESGPGADEAGVVIYIDRQLAGPYGRDRYRYTQPPFEVGVPEQGYQGRANPRQIYRNGIKLLDPGFGNLKPDAQDAALRKIEGTTFFRLLRQHTVEGMFCDPLHGGNAGMIGWQLIGFPGPYMSWADEIDKHYGRAFRPAPKSLEEVLGRPVKGWEEEQDS
jgi:gluconate 2-dehydrogenase gamma chain